MPLELVRVMNLIPNLMTALLVGEMMSLTFQQAGKPTQWQIIFLFQVIS